MAYFQTKDGSLEESIRKAVSGIQEKIEYVEYKFKNRNDAMKAKKMLDAIQLMGFEINDDNISNGEISVDAGNRDMTKYHKDIMKKFRPKVMTQEKLVGGQKKLDKDKDGDIDAKDFAMLRKDAKKESYELGTPENTKAKLNATPGQSADDWQQQVDTMQKKNASMREALAKVWGMEEGRNPFADNQLSKKEGNAFGAALEKAKENGDKTFVVGGKTYDVKTEMKKLEKETKTMTGKPMTKVNIDPDMKETKIGKKNVR